VSGCSPDGTGETVLGAEPCLEDPVRAEPFVFLTEDSEARGVVARGDDRREALVLPP